MPPTTNGTLPRSRSYSESETKNNGFSWYMPWGGAIGSTNSNSILPAYWSEERDIALMRYYIEQPMVAAIVQAVVKREIAIGYKCVPDDMTDEKNIQQAFWTQEIFNAWWETVEPQFALSLRTQDNGGFLEITGRGRSDRPILPTTIPGTNTVTFATGLRFMESSRCQRTGDSDHPILYTKLDGERIAFHRSRLMFFSDAQSTYEPLNGVGFCGLSRGIHMANNLGANILYEQEQLDDNPPRAMMIARGWNASPEEMAEPFKAAAQMNREKGYTNYQRMPFITTDSSDAQPIELLNFRSMPEGYNKTETFQIAMQSLALAFDIDVRDLWTATQVGATAADAETAHIKAQGRYIAWYISQVENQLNQWFAPGNCSFVADYIDDQQDANVAALNDKRMDYLTKAINSGTMSVTVARQKMVEWEMITEQQFEQMAEEDQQVVEPVEVVEDDEEIKSIAGDEFSDQLDTLARQAANGDIDQDEFESELLAIIPIFALAAWTEGAETDVLNEAQQAELDAEIQEMESFVPEMVAAYFVFIAGLSGAALAEAVLSFSDNRLSMWTNSIERVNQIGIVNDPNVEQFRWVYTVGKDHCVDCRMLNGRVRTKAEWDESGWVPRGRMLDCKGYRCGCRFEKVR